MAKRNHMGYHHGMAEHIVANTLNGPMFIEANSQLIRVIRKYKKKFNYE